MMHPVQQTTGSLVTAAATSVHASESILLECVTTHMPFCIHQWDTVPYMHAVRGTPLLLQTMSCPVC